MPHETQKNSTREGPNREENRVTTELSNGRHQMPKKLGLLWVDRDEVLTGPLSDEPREANGGGTGSGRENASLLSLIADARNVERAVRRVMGNKGSPGIDGMPVEALPLYMREHGSSLLDAIREGSYVPQPVRRQRIPKAGGERELGIPTAVDRVVQQCILQVLQPLIDPTFSTSSFGFRPGRGAHQALHQARTYIQEGRRWVVDVDLKQFFDAVSHDVMMSRVSRHVKDRGLLRIIRRFLESGILEHGVLVERVKGTPQGGPLSPLLANILLDEVDKALEDRGHRFARYADDCNVYVRSARAGARVLAFLRKKYAALHLQINESKSAVAPVGTRKFLGYSFYFAKGSKACFRVAEKSLSTFTHKIRQITRRTRGRSLVEIAKELQTYLRGWKSYFCLAETRKIFQGLDGWIRHRLRALYLTHWKRGRTIFRELLSRGMKKENAAVIAANGRRIWHNSAMLLNRAFPIEHFDRLGIPRLA